MRVHCIVPVSIPWQVFRFIETILLFEKHLVGEDEGEISGEGKRPVDIAVNDGAPTAQHEQQIIEIEGSAQP